MNGVLIQIIIPLFAAHLLSDFILQTDEDVKKKQSLFVFGKHILLVTWLSYQLVGDWGNYIIPLAILFTHSIIDLLKNSIKNDSLFIFSVDQAAHYLVILLLSLYMQNNVFQETRNIFWYNSFGDTYIKGLII